MQQESLLHDIFKFIKKVLEQVCSSMYGLLLPHRMNGLIILFFYCKVINGKVEEIGLS